MCVAAGLLVLLFLARTQRLIIRKVNFFPYGLSFKKTMTYFPGLHCWFCAWAPPRLLPRPPPTLPRQSSLTPRPPGHSLLLRFSGEALFISSGGVTEPAFLTLYSQLSWRSQQLAMSFLKAWRRYQQLGVVLNSLPSFSTALRSPQQLCVSLTARRRYQQLGVVLNSVDFSSADLRRPQQLGVVLNSLASSSVACSARPQQL